MLRAMHRNPGFTLVELLLAGVILVLVLVPVMGLMSSQKTDAQSEEGMGDAVSLAQEIVEKLLSPAIPFRAIDPAGGAACARGGVAGDVAQAGFRDVTVRDVTYSSTELETLLMDGEEEVPGEGLYRYRTYKNRTYYVCFFAGKYADAPPRDDPREPGFRRPDVENTLTFMHLNKPATLGQPFNFSGADGQVFNREIILDRPGVTVGGTNLETLPYAMTPHLVAPGGRTAEPVAPDAPYYRGDPSRTLPAGRKDWGLIPGWPDARRTEPRIVLDLNDPGTDQRAIWAKHAVDVVAGRNGRQLTIDYHPAVIDQQQIGLTNGALMKIVVGVRYRPYAMSHLRKAETVREFWLASLKADLEE